MPACVSAARAVRPRAPAAVAPLLKPGLQTPRPGPPPPPPPPSRQLGKNSLRNGGRGRPAYRVPHRPRRHAHRRRPGGAAARRSPAAYMPSDAPPRRCPVPTRRRSGPSFKRVGPCAHARPPRCALRRYKHDNCQAREPCSAGRHNNNNTLSGGSAEYGNDNNAACRAPDRCFPQSAGKNRATTLPFCFSIRRRIRIGTSDLEMQSKLRDHRSSEIL
jgi:hypothetical protein